MKFTQKAIRKKCIKYIKCIKIMSHYSISGI